MSKIPQRLQELDTPTLSLMVAAKAILAGASEIESAECREVLHSKASSRDYVTEVDFRAEAAILQSLEAGGVLRSEVLAEESAGKELSGEVATDCFLVDPLDATSAFIWGCGAEYPSIIIAKRSGAKTVAGIVYLPFSGTWYYAALGEGAYCNEQRLSLRTAYDLQRSWVVLNRQGEICWETKSFRELETKLRSSKGAGLLTAEVPHSAVSCKIASGKIGAVIHDSRPEMPKQMPWDIAAPKLILEEAGGYVCDFMGQPLSPFDIRPYVAAQSIELASEILSL